MRIASTLLFVLALTSCRRPSATAPDAALPDEPDAFAPGAPRLRAPRCRADGVTWFAPLVSGERYTDQGGVIAAPDAGDALFPAIESTVLARSGDASWALWTDSRDRRAHLARPSQPDRTAALGAGDRGEALLALAGAHRDTPVVAWTYDVAAGRAHTVRSVDALDRGCTQAEARDDALALTIAPTSRGVLVAWDDDDPGAAGGRVKVQLVSVPVPAGACGSVRQVSPPEHDAGDPLLVSTPDGAAVIAWLSARELERDQNNDTATEVWALALDATGATVGAPLRVTPTSGHRFGLSAAVSSDGASVWLAWRAAPESGTEARGDGGPVAVSRITRTALGLTRAGDASVVTANTANPTGATRVFALSARGRPAEVWWRERSGDQVVTLHRAIDAAGRAVGDATAAVTEPALRGELPVSFDVRGAEGQAVLRSPGGAVGAMRFRCDPSAR